MPGVFRPDLFSPGERHIIAFLERAARRAEAEQQELLDERLLARDVVGLRGFDFRIVDDRFGAVDRNRFGVGRGEIDQHAGVVVLLDLDFDGPGILLIGVNNGCVDVAGDIRRHRVKLLGCLVEARERGIERCGLRRQRQYEGERQRESAHALVMHHRFRWGTHHGLAKAMYPLSSSSESRTGSIRVNCCVLPVRAVRTLLSCSIRWLSGYDVTSSVSSQNTDSPWLGSDVIWLARGMRGWSRNHWRGEKKIKATMIAHITSYCQTPRR